MADIASISSGLRLGEDGIWHGAGREAVSYPADGNAACFGIEDRSFWFRHRNECIATVVRNFPPAAGEAIFDIGGGNGYVAAGLMKAGYATVPAYASLWSDEDEHAGHCRRYTAGSFCAALRTAGFAVEFSSYIFRPLPLPILLVRALPYRLRGARPPGAAREDGGDHKVQGGLATRLLGSVLRTEIANLENRRPMRFGGSCLVAARAV